MGGAHAPVSPTSCHSPLASAISHYAICTHPRPPTGLPHRKRICTLLLIHGGTVARSRLGARQMLNPWIRAPWPTPYDFYRSSSKSHFEISFYHDEFDGVCVFGCNSGICIPCNFIYFIIIIIITYFIFVRTLLIYYCRFLRIFIFLRM